MTFEAVALSVEGVPCDRVSQALKMDADLVGASCAGHAGNECPAITGGEKFVVSHGVASRGGTPGGHFLALDRMTADGEIDGSFGMTRPSPDDGEIGFLDLAIREGLGERCVSLIVLRNDDAATRFLIKSMDDAGTMLLGARRE